tara:strand:+ start:428 stop:886 length:459 start_codon:yes stop_codon:yes gene_type:complete
MYLKHNQIAQFREDFTPEECPVLLRESNDWCLDHDHQTGLVRGVLSREGNSLLGKVENFYLNMCRGKKSDLPIVLRAMADYLDFPAMNVMHPVGLTQLVKRFGRDLTASEQVDKLKGLGADEENLDACKNEKTRKLYYRQLLIQSYNNQKNE